MKAEHPMLDRLFAGKVIVNCERQPYLHRWYLIKREWLSLFLHKFVRSDEDRALHDHPWGFVVIPIWRGYIEHSDRPKFSPEIMARVRISYFWLLRSPDPLTRRAAESAIREVANERQPIRRRVWPIIGTRIRSATYRHRVELMTDKAGNPLPSWSLFFHFKRVRDWGFWPKEGFTLWNKWWQEKCE